MAHMPSFTLATLSFVLPDTDIEYTVSDVLYTSMYEHYKSFKPNNKYVTQPAPVSTAGMYATPGN